MLITTSIELDYKKRKLLPPIAAVQGDSNTRAIVVSLLNGGESWSPPAEAKALVAYKRPDGAEGCYDKLSDGSDAVSIGQSILTAYLSQKALAVPGNVHISVILYNDTEQLAMFPFIIQVAPNPCADITIFDDACTYPTLEALNNALGNIEDLTTTNKDNVVAAINELKENGWGGSGADGVGIASVEQTKTSTEDGGKNEITVTLTDGSTSVFTVKNGSKGSPGADGYTNPLTVNGVAFDGSVAMDMTDTINAMIDEKINALDATGVSY